MKNIVTIILFVFLIVACSKKENKHFSRFPKLYQLKGKKVETKIPFKFGTFYLYDSLIIVSNTFDTKKFIHIYDRSDYKYLSSSATIGRGPGEISNPFQAILDAKNKSIWCMDFGKRKLLKFPIDSILMNPDYVPVTSVQLPTEKRLIISYQKYDNKIFSFLNNEPDALISFFNNKGDILDSLSIPDNIGYYKNPKELRRSNTVLYLYGVHPSKEKIVLAFRFSDIIKIIDRNGNVIESEQGPDNINEDPLAPLDESTLAYFEMRTDKNYIYGLYQGIKRVIKENGRLISTFPHRLFIFDWDLKPVASIVLEYSASSFLIDKLNHHIITYSPDFGGLIIYSLPDF